MEKRNDHTRKKGGRPRKTVKRDQLLGVKSTLVERKAIEAKAKSVQLSVSEYLRKMGLTGKIDRSERALPKDVLQLIGTLNHVAANLNQIARKRNRGDELNAIERATLQQDEAWVRQLTKDLKKHFQ